MRAVSIVPLVQASGAGQGLHEDRFGILHQRSMDRHRADGRVQHPLGS